jgi:hypothetical protein
VVLEVSGGKNTVVRMVLFDLEAFVSSHGLKFDGTGDSFIRCIRVLREVEYFPTCMVKKKTSACVIISFFTKTVGQAALNGGKKWSADMLSPGFKSSVLRVMFFSDGCGGRFDGVQTDAFA